MRVEIPTRIEGFSHYNPDLDERKPNPTEDPTRIPEFITGNGRFGLIGGDGPTVDSGENENGKVGPELGRQAKPPHNKQERSRRVPKKRIPTYPDVLPKIGGGD